MTTRRVPVDLRNSTMSGRAVEVCNPPGGTNSTDAPSDAASGPAAAASAQDSPDASTTHSEAPPRASTSASATSTDSAYGSELAYRTTSTPPAEPSSDGSCCASVGSSAAAAGDTGSSDAAKQAAASSDHRDRRRPRRPPLVHVSVLDRVNEPDPGAEATARPCPGVGAACRAPSYSSGAIPVGARPLQRSSNDRPVRSRYRLCGQTSTSLPLPHATAPLSGTM